MRGRRILVGAAVIVGTLLAVLGTIRILVSPANPGRTMLPRQTASPTAGSPTRTSTTPPTAPFGRWRPVAPATTVPAETPVQRQYDDGLAQGLSSSSDESTIKLAESLELPRPAIGGGWPALAPSDTPDGFVRGFVTALLDVDFTRQTRSALGAWLVAESAPDLMPGIPAAFAERTLYVSVMEPSLARGLFPLPSAGPWALDAREHVRFSASDIEVQLDPEWQSMVDAGWQPQDLRAAVEDVSGILSVTRGRSVTRRRFWLVVQVGSARFADSYGAALVSDWKESEL